MSNIPQEGNSLGVQNSAVQWINPQVPNPFTTQGDIIVANASAAPTRLGIGSTGTALLSDGTKPYWGTVAGSGSVTSVTSANSDISVVNPTSTPLLTLNSASINTASTIVKRDASGNFAAGTITAALTGTASGNELPLTFNTPLTRSTNTISINQATTSIDGYLSHIDWNTFNNKQNALTLGNLTESTSSVLTITGGTSAIIGSGLTIQVKQATTAQSGYISNTDWNTFNGKQNALGYSPVNKAGDTMTGNLIAPTSISSKTTNYTLTTSDHTVEFDTTSGALTATLPTAASSTGLAMTVSIIAGSNSLSLSANGIEKINGTNSWTINNIGSALSVQSDGTGWTFT